MGARAVTALDLMAVQSKTATEDLLPDRELVCNGAVWYVLCLFLSLSHPCSTPLWQTVTL